MDRVLNVTYTLMLEAASMEEHFNRERWDAELAAEPPERRRSILAALAPFGDLPGFTNQPLPEAAV